MSSPINNTTAQETGGVRKGAEDVGDVFVDMQYAKRDCTDPMAFAREPWTYYKDTNTFLGLRVQKRAETRDNLKAEDQETIAREEKQIQQTRRNFSSYKSKMMSDLRDARREWKNEAKEKCDIFSREIRKRPEYPRGWKRSREQDLKLLKRVRVWETEDEPEDSIKGPHKEPEYGLKACAIYFKKVDAQYEGYTHNPHKFNAKGFPNQKLPVHDLIEPGKDNPLSEMFPENSIRYFHFPTNNMRWIERAMARYYREPDGKHDEVDLKPTDAMTRTEKLLSREFWRGQLHGGAQGRGGAAGGGSDGPVHARHMRSRCSIVPEDSQSGAYVQRSNKKNFVIFLPYLHWETGSRRSKMAEVVKEVTLERLKEEAQRSPGNAKPLMIRKLEKKSKKGLFEVVQDEKKKKKKPTKSLLGNYLFMLAQAYDAMDYEADERLLREDLHHNPPLHIRRTLDQYYFLTLEDTAVRDKDQVVYRETRAGRSFHSRNTRVVMVDQLWLWILDNNTIISSFPRRWGRNKPDPSGVHKSLRERLAQLPKGEIKSVYDLALIIIDQCSRVFFDRTKPLDQRPEVMDLFASAIGNVTEHTTIAYDTFWRNMELRALKMPPWSSPENSNHKYLDINPEGTLLRETQDISEELQIMLRIYNQQLHVVRDFRKYLGYMNGESKNETNKVRSMKKLLESLLESSEARELQGEKVAQPVPEKTVQPVPETVPEKAVQPVPEDTIQQANDILELISNRQSEIQELEDAASRTNRQLQGLLTLKQQQAGIIEAKAALERADESVKQGRSIMAFTLVTIFFLPLGFLAAFFGMNNKEINQAAWMTLDEQLKYMFGISAGVIVIAISMAFSHWTRATLTILVKVPLVFIAEYTSLRRYWRYWIVGQKHLEKKAQQTLEHIYGREERLKKKKLEGEKQKKREEEKQKEEAKRVSEAEEDETRKRRNSPREFSGTSDNTRRWDACNVEQMA